MLYAILVVTDLKFATVPDLALTIYTLLSPITTEIFIVSQHKKAKNHYGNSSKNKDFGARAVFKAPLHGPGHTTTSVKGGHLLSSGK